MIHRYQKIYLLILLVIVSTGCKKLVDVNPPITSINEANVYSNDATAISVLTGIYSNVIGSNYPGGINSLSFYPSLSADELTLYGGIMGTMYLYYTNVLTNTNGVDFWNDIYPEIYVTNSAVAGLNASSALTPQIKQQLLGEAKFMRAFFYFYLVNLYGNVPLVTSTNYTINNLLPRAPAATVYQQIISDLKDAQSSLSTNYLDGTLLNTTAAKVRPTSWAATSLLARCYLYTNDWADAESQATAVIGSSQFNLSPLTGSNSVFLMNSAEAIWQLQPTKVGENTPDAQIFIIPPTGPSSSYPVYLSNSLLESFENGDQRRLNWVDSVVVTGTTYYFPYKYQAYLIGAPVTEYEMVLRLGEQYLIRAEARAEQGNLTGAASDLNAIRQRAGLNATTAITQLQLLTAIQHERQVELFTEWGHRWLDLKRTGLVDSVMANVEPQKGGNWSNDWALYPLPLTDLQADPKLTQNPGY